MPQNVMTYVWRLTETGASVWFISWAIRRHYGLQNDLDASAQRTRWGIVTVCFLLCFVPGEQLSALLVISLLLGLLFIAWPGATVHVRGIIGRMSGRLH